MILHEPIAHAPIAPFSIRDRRPIIWGFRCAIWSACVAVARVRHSGVTAASSAITSMISTPGRGRAGRAGQMTDQGSLSETCPSRRKNRRSPARARSRRFRHWAIAVLLPVLALCVAIAFPPGPFLVWNASASAPIGLYAIGGRDAIERGDMVLARVPERLRPLAAERRYIPINVPLVKRVAAIPGDSVCAHGEEIFVNGRPIAERRGDDGMGRTMPWWSGCVALRDGALFLLMDDSGSFDGRYFGPTRRGDIISRVRLLWAR